MNIFRILLSIAGFATALYALFSLTLYIMQDRLIFLPPAVNEKIYEPWREQAYQLEVDGRQLHGWITRGRGDNPGIIIYFGGNAEDVVYNLYDKDRYAAAHLVFTNYAGYGRSKGQPSQQVMFQDALAVYDHVRERLNADTEQIYVMGRSVGSSVATHVATHRPVAGLILITPLDSVENVARHYYPWFPVGLLLKHPFSTIDHIHQVDSPILMIAAEQDEVIPQRNLLNLRDAAPDNARMVTVTDANHQDISSYDSYFDHINQFVGHSRGAD